MAHRILLNSGDSIDESELQTAFAAMGQGYIEQGALDIQYFDDGTIDTTPALARIPNNNQDIPLYVDAITDYSLEANAVNNVWLVVDPAVASDDAAVGLAHNTTGVAPTDPNLKIAEVDTNKSGAAAVTLLNRGLSPALDGAEVDLGGLSVQGGAAQMALDGLVVPVAPGVGALDAVHADSATPVQDAIDTVAAAGDGDGGGVLLPPTTVTEFAHIDLADFVHIRGWGNRSTIEFTDYADCGVDATNCYAYAMENLHLRGPGTAQPTQPAFRNIKSSDAGADVRLSHLFFDRWVGDGCVMTIDGGQPNASYFDQLTIRNCDGNGGALIKLIGASAPLRFGNVNAYPSDRYSGKDSTIIDSFRVPFSATQLNIGGTADRAVRCVRTPARIGLINYEPHGKNSPTDTVVLREGPGSLQVGQLSITHPDQPIKRAYTLRGPTENNILGPVRGEPSTDTRVLAEPDSNGVGPRGTSYYYGPADEIAPRGVDRLYIQPLADTLTHEYFIGGYNDQTAARTIGTTYTNDTRKPLYVTMTVASSGYLNALIRTGRLASEATVKSQVEMQNPSGNRQTGTLHAIVPPDHEYAVVDGDPNKSATIRFWQEALLG